MNCMSNLIHLLPVYDKSLCSKSSIITDISDISRSVSCTPTRLKNNVFIKQTEFDDFSNNFVSNINKKGFPKNLNYLFEKFIILGGRYSLFNENKSNNKLLNRSRSANALHNIRFEFFFSKKNCKLRQNNDLFLIIYISIAMLESKIDNEYLLAIKLLNKVIINLYIFVFNVFI